jgi:DNA-directed RNA polymerase subunit H (RpoH/RPB5)
MSFEFIDALYRSRITILDIMELRGFDTIKYRNFSPKEIEAMSVAPITLNMVLPHKTDDNRQANIIYHLTRMSRQKLSTVLDDYLPGVLESADSKVIDAVLMMNDAIGEMHHKASLDYVSRDLKALRHVSMFCIYNLVNNPLKHVLVPPHTIVPAEEHKELMDRLMITSKGQLAMIRFHEDPITRCIGILPGDIVKIERPSQSIGVYVTYRVCVP